MVLKRTFNRDLIDEYLDDPYQDIGPCECFEEREEEGDEQRHSATGSIRP